MQEQREAARIWIEIDTGRDDDVLTLQDGYFDICTPGGGGLDLLQDGAGRDLLMGGRGDDVLEEQYGKDVKTGAPTHLSALARLKFWWRMSRSPNCRAGPTSSFSDTGGSGTPN